MTLSLLYEDDGKALRLLGLSEPVAPAANGGKFVHRLKLLDREGDLADDINLSGAILRLKLPASSIKLQDRLKETGHLESSQEICHNFRLSVRAEKTGGEDKHQAERPTRLVRVRWEGQQVEEGYYDSRSRLFASLEFDRSMLAPFELLKEAPWVSLVPEKADSAQATPNAVVPADKQLSEHERSTIGVQFPAGSLAKGWCYKLKLSSIGPLDFDAELLDAEMKVCTSNCHCDQKGTARCDEASGRCECRFPFIGEDCSQCAEGHTQDPTTGECTPDTHCIDHGGKEDCHGHGTCEQRGETASCTCSPGFVDDGLEKCAKCADPLFQYPDC